MTKSKSLLTILVALVVTALTVAACGDTATNTPAAASGASTPTTGSRATTSAMTTAAMTTAAMTSSSAAMTTVATTPGSSMMTTAAMTPGSNMVMSPGATMSGAMMTTSSASTGTTTSGGSIPTVTDLTEIPLTSAQASELNKTLKINNADIKLYSSNDDAATVAATFDKTITGQGYTFGIPGSTAPLSTNGATIGLYSKSGSNDVMFVAVAIPAGTDTNNLSLPGFTKEEVQQVANQLKDKKTVVIGVSGPSLLQALITLGSSGAGSSGAAMTTSAATPAPTK